MTREAGGGIAHRLLQRHIAIAASREAVRCYLLRVPEPWSLSVAIDWEPTIRHFERRLKWLADADTLHHADSFRVTADLVGLRWGDGAHEVTVSSDGTRAQSASSDPSAVLALIEAALRLIEPSRFRSLNTSLQFVVPLKGTYDEIRVTAGQSIFAELAQQERLTDWAVLFDSEQPRFMRQFEFGIVSAREIPPRLARSLGRMSDGRTPVLGESYWAHRPELPPVALFVDGTWTGRQLNMKPTEAWLAPWWNEVREDAEGAVGAIISRVT